MVAPWLSRRKLRDGLMAPEKHAATPSRMHKLHTFARFSAGGTTAADLTEKLLGVEGTEPPAPAISLLYEA